MSALAEAPQSQARIGPAGGNAHSAEEQHVTAPVDESRQGWSRPGGSPERGLASPQNGGEPNDECQRTGFGALQWFGAGE